MTLANLLQTILNSDFSDWNVIEASGGLGGPSYKSRFSFENVYEGSANVLREDSHSIVAAYKNDLSISMAFGMVSNSDYVEPWANNFPDPHTTSNHLDIFYNNSLVIRRIYLSVDGNRCVLPLPGRNENQDLTVERDYYRLIKLVEKLNNDHEFDANFDYYFNQTGIRIIEENWLE